MTRSLADASSPCSTRSRARARTTSAAGKWSSGLVREVEQHIRRALRTLASPTTLSEQEEIDGFCKVLGLGDDWNYTPR